MAGIIPALVGLAVAPLASRVRGLYLAIVTLGLVFVGEHLFRELRSFTGGPGTGRRAARPEIFGFQLDRGGEIFGIDVPGHVRLYLFCLVICVVMAVVAKNLARSKIGRAFAAVRDRDIAAEIMGVPLMRTKVIAFTISSFYAGICGALLAVAVGGFISTEFYNLLLSVEFLAMILIGGVATISGSFMGAAFVVLLPRLVQNLAHYVPFITAREGGGGLLTVFQLETILFGSLIVAFLILEPRGLYGLWLRVRNYWKAWPFSY
jgi:branched-chain amino acid transport system permease protein